MLFDNNLVWHPYYLDDKNNWISLHKLILTTTKLEFSSSIHSLFAYGEWAVSTSPSFLEDKIPVIGRALKFVLTDNVGVLTYYMNILSVVNISGSSSSTVGEAFQLTLISPWYFAQKIGSGAYKGNVGSIIKNIISTELIEKIAYQDIMSPTYEKGSTYYRTKMTPAKFFDSIAVNALGENNKATFLYTDVENRITLKSHVITEAEETVAISLDHPQMSSYQDLAKTSPGKVINPMAMTIVINKINGQSGDLFLDSDPTFSFVYPLSGMSFKDKDPGKKLKDIINNHRKWFYYMIDKKNERTRVIASKTGYNTNSILQPFINTQSKLMMKYHQIILVTLPNIRVTLGKFCDLKLIRDAITPSIFGKKYIIESISHVFQGFKLNTVITLSSPGISYEEDSEATGLFHREDID